MAKNTLDKKTHSVRAGKIISNTLTHAFLIIMCLVWIIPFVWLILQSFRDGKGQFIRTFFPTEYSLDSYIKLLTDKTVLNFPRMFLNTFAISILTCIFSTFIVLAVSYCTSRLKWKMRKTYMNMAMIINLFPGFMSMVAVYFLLKALGMLEGDKVFWSLVICFTSGSGTGFFIMKGYMDTIPKALDEAAYLDGATKWQTFYKITLPLCKPMIVYQVITSFMGPWVDFVFAKILTIGNSKYFTVSIGLFNMLEKEYVDAWFVPFCCGAVLVSIPIAILFMYTQKFYQEAMSGSVKG